MVILETSELTKIYGADDSTVYAVNNAKLKLEEGEFGVVTGPSGSGKSTLIRLLCGLTAPSTGKVEFRGEDITYFKPDASAEYRLKKIGSVTREPGLLDYMTLEENISLPAIIAGRKSFTGQLKDITERVGLTDKLKKFPDEVSCADRQRCAVARALINDATLLLCDEICGDLDEMASEAMLRLLLALNGTGITILLATLDTSASALVAAEAAKPNLFNMRSGILSR